MLADLGMVVTYLKSAHVNDLGFAWPGPPPCCMDWPHLLVPMVFLPGGFAIPCSYTLHHPYICSCFWRKHFYTPLFLYLLWNANYTWVQEWSIMIIPSYYYYY